MPYIEIKIAPGGDVKIDAIGFSGSACEQATKEIEDALGDVAERTKKNEYFQQERVSQRQQRAGRG